MKRKIDTFWYWFLVIVSFVVCYMFTCATRTKAEILTGEITYNEGQELIDGNRTITISKQSKYKIVEVYDTTYKIYLNCNLSGTVLTCSEYTMIGDYNSYTGKISTTNEFSIINGKLISHIQTGYFYSIKKASSGYTQEDLNAKYQEGFEAGKNSVDITSDNEEYANEVVNELMIQFDMLMQSLENEWNATLEYINEKVGFITEEDIFNIWDITEGGLIEDPSYKTEYYLTKLEQRWNIWLEEVKATVDITSDNLAYAEQYLRDKLAHEEIYDAESVSALIEYYNQMLVALENGWNADLEFLNNILAFTENEIIKIYDGTLNFVMEPEQKNQYYQELIMQQLELYLLLPNIPK